MMAPDVDKAANEASDGADDTRAAGRFPRNARLLVALAAVLVVSTMGGAAAAGLITGRQIKDGTVTGRDIRDHSLRSKDAKAGLVRPGPQGPAGQTGAVGADGPTGASGRSGLGGLVTLVSPDPFTVPGTDVAESDLPCPNGFTALGGGAAGADQNAVDHMVLTRSEPTNTLNGWDVGAFNSSASDIGVYVWVQCAPI
jgi:hypothetical protein